MRANKIVNAFIDFKNLGEEAAYTDIKRQILIDVGLLDDKSVILRLEQTWQTYIAAERKKAASGSSGKSYSSK